MESHQRDHENYVACSRSHRRRAKALLDFERHDDDELGFRKNDIITVRGRGSGGGAQRQVEPGCWEQAPLVALRVQPGYSASPSPVPAKDFHRPGLGGVQGAGPRHIALPPALSTDHFSEGRALLGRGAEWPKR